MVSDRAAGAFRGGPNRSQTCVPCREPWQRGNRPITLPVTEKGLEAVGDCSPRQRPSQVILLIFWWKLCERGGCLRKETTPLKTLFPLGCSVSFPSSSPSPSPLEPSKATMVLLVTSDNEQFVVDKEVAERSVLIKNMLEGKSTVPRGPSISYLTIPLTPRRRGERPTNPIAQRLFVCAEKSLSSSRRPCLSTCRLIALIA